MKKILLARAMRVLVMLAIAGAASAAFADIVVINGFKYSGALDTKISEAGRTIGSTATPGPHPGQSVDVYAGEFSGINNGKSFSAYCVDIFKYDALNVMTNYSTSDLNVTFGFTKASDLAKLANQRYGSVTNAKTSAAFQIATWEILFESAGSPYKLGSDTFKAVGGSAASGSSSALTLAQSWLDGLASSPVTFNYDVNYLQVASGNQNLVFFTPSSSFITSSIPEPGTYRLMLAGLGLLGLAARRKKRESI